MSAQRARPLPKRYARTEQYFDLWIAATWGETFGNPRDMDRQAKAVLIAWLLMREEEEARK